MLDKQCARSRELKYKIIRSKKRRVKEKAPKKVGIVMMNEGAVFV